MTFDFRPIAEKYPKAFTLLKEWIEKNFHGFEGLDRDGSIITVDDVIELTPISEWFDPLELDFFFDEQGIAGNVGFSDDYAWNNKLPQSWFMSYYVMLGNEGVEMSVIGLGKFSSRAEALQALWLKEFGILESKLS